MKLKLKLLAIFLLVMIPVSSHSNDLPAVEKPVVSAVTDQDINHEDVKKYAADGITGILNEQFPFLELSYADPDDGEDSSGYILGYDWEKKWDNLTYDRSDDSDRFTWEYYARLFTKGSHALGNATPTKNKAEAGVSIGITRAHLGTLQKKLVKEGSVKYQECMSAVDDSPENRENYIKETQVCADRYKAYEIYQANQASQSQWVYGLDAIAEIEADENYSQKHYVYGLEVFACLSPATNGALTWVNILDWPFYVVRKAFGQDDGFRPNWPVIRLGVQSVDVKDNDARAETAPEEDQFERVYGEIAFTTVLCKIDGRSIKFNSSYEIYRELDAESRIEAAGLDEFDFFSASFQIPVALLVDRVSDNQMFFVRYTDGELPFDRKSTKSFEVGWKTDLNLESIFSSIGDN